jgi:transposase
MVEQVVVGIDVSKAKLDVAILPGGEQFTVSNDRPGIGELVRRLSRLAPSLVVLEQPANLNSWRSVSWLPPGCR